jgi:hypothetical protein
MAALFSLVTTVIVNAQIPVTKEPHHRVVSRTLVRIMDVNVPPHEATLDHSHDLDRSRSR